MTAPHGLKWIRTFEGLFANQNIVCKLRDDRTLEFVLTEFGAK